MGPRGGSGGGGWLFYSTGQLTEPCASKGGCSPQDADTRYTHSCSPGPRLAVGARHPPCSQADTVIGRRPDIPRETHLHAWVTLLPPASSLCRQSELAVSCGRLEPVSMATRSCRPVASKRRKKVGRHRCGAVTPVWCGRPRADRGSCPLRLELHLRSRRADSLHRWHLLGEPRSEGSDHGEAAWMLPCPFVTAVRIPDGGTLVRKTSRSVPLPRSSLQYQGLHFVLFLLNSLL